jgi:hypothetical protein
MVVYPAFYTPFAILVLLEKFMPAMHVSTRLSTGESTRQNKGLHANQPARPG